MGLLAFTEFCIAHRDHDRYLNPYQVHPAGTLEELLYCPEYWWEIVFDNEWAEARYARS